MRTIFMLNTMFKILKNKNVFIKNFWPIVDDSLAIPATDVAAIERIFFITNMCGNRWQIAFSRAYNQSNNNI